MICLLLSNDLMFGSQVRGALQRVGGKLTTVTSIDELEQAATRAEGSYVVLIDLGLAGIQVADVVTRLRAQSVTTRYRIVQPPTSITSPSESRVSCWNGAPLERVSV